MKIKLAKTKHFYTDMDVLFKVVYKYMYMAYIQAQWCFCQETQTGEGLSHPRTM